MSRALITFNQLSVSFAADKNRVRAVQDVSFTIRAGQTVGVVGESGCGKSVTAMSLMDLLPPQAARIDGGEILLRAGPAAAEKRPYGRPARQSAGDDFSGADERPESGTHRRRAALRTADSPPRRAAEGRMAARYPAPDGCRAGARGEPDGQLSASAFRRHAAAGDDCHGAELPAEAADCR